ncbi:DMT family transporter [Glacieibacterium megasporae]|uniref:DMT family transporter n=1 Tax=Glacieibacterium megasporae TaxID=2835787 RepID=UPI001C1E0DF0|nr:EamA family transporter [Polymorphobacter megasporae]UAJ10604.1 EamA family transporter [Polymorphobacter megasporae]
MSVPWRAGGAAGVWSNSRRLIVLAVAYQWFYNGANYLAFKIAGDALHPLIVATIRFAVAGLLLLPFAIARRKRASVTPRQIVNAAIVGIILLVASQALAIWGTHFLPAGVASVFGSAAPLFLALFAWAIYGRPLTRRQLAGVVIGFVGLALIGWSSATNAGFSLVGAGLTLTASACWALGSLLAPRLKQPDDSLVALTTQLLAAGFLLALIVTAAGLAGKARFDHVPLSAWGAIGFLIVASTLIGYAVFLALNSHVSSTLANTFNYAAPVISILLAALLLHEPLTTAKIAAATITLAGVALMIGGSDGKRAHVTERT